MESISLEEIFGEPISIYTGAEAVDDGTLVDLTQFTRVLFHGLPINWMTLHLFDDFKPFFVDEEGYVKNFGADLGSILRTKLQFAQGDPGNSERSEIPSPSRRICGLSATKSAAGPPCTRRTTDPRRKKRERAEKPPALFSFCSGND